MRTETLVSGVQRVLNAYIESNPDASMNEVADKAMSAVTTIRGLKNGTIEYLSAKKAVEISTRLGGPKTLDALVGLTGDTTETAEASQYQQHFPHLFPYEMQPSSVEPYLADKDFARIIWAAFGATHIKREEIEFRWGREGISRLEELLRVGLLIEEEGLVKGNSENGGFGLDSTLTQLQNAVELYSPANRMNQENWVSFQTQSVTPEFIKEFRERMRLLFTEFHDKSNTSEAQGNHRVFFGMMFDRYMPDLNDPKELQ